MSGPLLSKYRKFVTTGVGFTFVVVGITGLIFKFFFKTPILENIHGWLGVALVCAALLHITQNWKPLLQHFRDWRVFVFLLPVGLVIGYFSLTQKETSQKVNPKQVMRKLTKSKTVDLAKVFGKDSSAIAASMEKDGLRVEGFDETVEDLAHANKTSPDHILMYFVQ